MEDKNEEKLKSLVKIRLPQMNEKKPRKWRWFFIFIDRNRNLRQ